MDTPGSLQVIAIISLLLVGGASQPATFLEKALPTDGPSLETIEHKTEMVNTTRSEEQSPVRPSKTRQQLIDETPEICANAWVIRLITEFPTELGNMSQKQKTIAIQVHNTTMTMEETVFSLVSHVNKKNYEIHNVSGICTKYQLVPGNFTCSTRKCISQTKEKRIISTTVKDTYEVYLPFAWSQKPTGGDKYPEPQIGYNTGTGRLNQWNKDEFVIKQCRKKRGKRQITVPNSTLSPTGTTDFTKFTPNPISPNSTALNELEQKTTPIGTEQPFNNEKWQNLIFGNIVTKMDPQCEAELFQQFNISDKTVQVEFKVTSLPGQNISCQAIYNTEHGINIENKNCVISLIKENRKIKAHAYITRTGSYEWYAQQVTSKGIIQEVRNLVTIVECECPIVKPLPQGGIIPLTMPMRVLTNPSPILIHSALKFDLSKFGLSPCSFSPMEWQTYITKPLKRAMHGFEVHQRKKRDLGIGLHSTLNSWWNGANSLGLTVESADRQKYDQKILKVLQNLAVQQRTDVKNQQTLGKALETPIYTITLQLADSLTAAILKHEQQQNVGITCKDIAILTVTQIATYLRDIQHEHLPVWFIEQITNQILLPVGQVIMPEITAPPILNPLIGWNQSVLVIGLTHQLTITTVQQPLYKAANMGNFQDWTPFPPFILANKTHGFSIDCPIMRNSFLCHTLPTPVKLSEWERSTSTIYQTSPQVWITPEGKACLNHRNITVQDRTCLINKPGCFIPKHPWSAGKQTIVPTQYIQQNFVPDTIDTEDNQTRVLQKEMIEAISKAKRDYGVLKQGQIALIRHHEAITTILGQEATYSIKETQALISSIEQEAWYNNLFSWYDGSVWSQLQLIIVVITCTIPLLWVLNTCLFFKLRRAIRRERDNNIVVEYQAQTRGRRTHMTEPITKKQRAKLLRHAKTNRRLPRSLRATPAVSAFEMVTFDPQEETVEINRIDPSHENNDHGGPMNMAPIISADSYALPTPYITIMLDRELLNQGMRKVITLLNDPAREVFNKAYNLVTTNHFTLAYGCDESAGWVNQHAEYMGKPVIVTLAGLVITPVGLAWIPLPQQEPLEKLFMVPNSMPHVTVAMADYHETKEMGKIVKDINNEELLLVKPQLFKWGPEGFFVACPLVIRGVVTGHSLLHIACPATAVQAEGT
uniref:Envelope glycoprotein n=1 Tax=Walleye dermal sarcoma virus TaxID=39720 RepID=ENV_WDSV|nr:RecName: Full=Envelope glycoprotein; AltName: Full=Env polyprotein; Contains: RecName: Full=Surface protein; Short=SU; Contains: RecName: Full=Transmembrane protein; Short=TM; Flags: Precursor [Walleye dermal sarcoma virus]